MPKKKILDLFRENFFHVETYILSSSLWILRNNGILARRAREKDCYRGLKCIEVISCSRRTLRKAKRLLYG